MNFADIIRRKRDGEIHTFEELHAIAMGAAEGTIPDYQLSAWLMAAYLKPLSDQETSDLTKAMAESGSRIDLSGLPKPWVDKHSTGGVGDKTTLVLLPMLAACGLTVVKMSGRGLGVTGGTIDKLGAIPGMRLDLTPQEMKRQAAEIGLALTGQSPNLAPADKALYALRDVTATVDSMPLIVSSILSKKIAGGADTIVLDVKCGSGAFMQTPESAAELAKLLISTGKRLGLSVTASISDMSQPLGSMVGNALEVKEAIEVLSKSALSEPANRFRDLCLYYCAETLVTCGQTASMAEGKEKAEQVLESGQAFSKFKQWIAAQGGTPVWEDNSLPTAPVTREILYKGHPAWVKEVPAVVVGTVVIDLGGGRREKADTIDPAVGVELHVMAGSKVQPGQLICRVHARNEVEAEAAVKTLPGAITYADTAVPYPPLILG